MGGGGGGSSRGLGDTSDLENQAKNILMESQSGRKNVFISFSSKDLNEVNLLRGQAKNEKSEIEFSDRSVREPFDSDRAEYLRQKITERINQASTTVVYLSDNTSGSDWVEWEVNKSIELGKRVIAVHPGDTPPTNIPSFVSKNKINVVSWSNLAAEIEKE